jgi:hypothetical protein
MGGGNTDGGIISLTPIACYVCLFLLHQQRKMMHSAKEINGKSV